LGYQGGRLVDVSHDPSDEAIEIANVWVVGFAAKPRIAHYQPVGAIDQLIRQRLPERRVARSTRKEKQF
jgi:hypothetical protein